MNYSTPNNTAKPLSTPENPINAIASRPAVTSAIAIPCIPFGIFTRLSCSRIPANNTIAKAKPRAVEKAYQTVAAVQFENAYYSYAVGDARQEVIDSARFTAPPMKEDGVLQVLEKLIDTL